MEKKEKFTENVFIIWFGVLDLHILTISNNSFIHFHSNSQSILICFQFLLLILGEGTLGTHCEQSHKTEFVHFHFKGKNSEFDGKNCKTTFLGLTFQGHFLNKFKQLVQLY